MKRFFTIILCLGVALSAAPARAQDDGVETIEVITLNRGIALILKDSWLVKLAGDQSALLAGEVLLSRSALLPRVSANIGETYLRYQPQSRFGSTSLPTSERNYYAYGVDVYQTLFDFGRALFYYRAAQEMVEAYRANKEAVTRLAVLEFITAYFDALEAKKMIVVAEKEVQNLAAYLKDTQRLYEAGVAVKNDLLPVEVRLADARQKLIEARDAETVALARLKNILALKPGSAVEVKDGPVPTYTPVVTPAARAAALQDRPELAFLDRQVRAFTFSGKAQALDDYLTVFAQAGYGRTRNRYSVHEDNSYISLGARIGLYDGGRRQGEAAVERSHRQQVEDSRSKLVQDIYLELESSNLAFKNARQRVQVASGALGQARENVRVNRVKYTVGSATTTEVLEAITMEVEARTNYYRAAYAAKRGAARLLYAMGRELAAVYGGPIKEAHGEKR